MTALLSSIINFFSKYKFYLYLTFLNYKSIHFNKKKNKYRRKVFNKSSLNRKAAQIKKNIEKHTIKEM